MKRGSVWVHDPIRSVYCVIFKGCWISRGFPNRIHAVGLTLDYYFGRMLETRDSHISYALWGMHDHTTKYCGSIGVTCGWWACGRIVVLWLEGTLWGLLGSSSAWHERSMVESSVFGRTVHRIATWCWCSECLEIRSCIHYVVDWRVSIYRQIKHPSPLHVFFAFSRFWYVCLGRCMPRMVV